jgi:hypothetical protein
MDAALDDVFIDDITFPATGGYPLAGTLLLSRGPKRHAVLINSATAVQRPPGVVATSASARGVPDRRSASLSLSGTTVEYVTRLQRSTGHASPTSAG